MKPFRYENEKAIANAIVAEAPPLRAREKRRKREREAVPLRERESNRDHPRSRSASASGEREAKEARTGNLPPSCPFALFVASPTLDSPRRTRRPRSSGNAILVGGLTMKQVDGAAAEATSRARILCAASLADSIPKQLNRDHQKQPVRENGWNDAPGRRSDLNGEIGNGYHQG